MTSKEKYNDIDLSQMPKGVKDKLDIVVKASKNWTVDSPKIDAAMDKIYELIKAKKPEGLKSYKPKAKPAPKATSTSKPKTTHRKKPTTAKTTRAQSAAKPKTAKTSTLSQKGGKTLLQTVQSDPQLKSLINAVGNSGKLHLERDAGRPAKPAGRRVSAATGKVYYESRPNRSDKKAPDFKGGYPYLKKGGVIHPKDSGNSFLGIAVTPSGLKRVGSFASKNAAISTVSNIASYLKDGFVAVINKAGKAVFVSNGLNAQALKFAKGGVVSYDIFDENGDISYVALSSPEVVERAQILAEVHGHKDKIKSFDDAHTYLNKKKGYEVVGNKKLAKGGKVGEPYDSMTKYQLETELAKLTEEFYDIRKSYNTTEHPRQIEINKEKDKIITLLYGDNFSGIGKKYAKGGEVGDYFYDNRKDKIFQVVFEDRGKMGIQYMKMDKSPIGAIEKIDKSDFEYNVSQGVWGKWKQEFAEGGEVVYRDMFEYYEDLPEDVAEVVERMSEMSEEGEMDYAETKRFLDKVESLGYTFDYGLDGTPYGLRPKGVELSQLEGYEEYAKGGKIKSSKDDSSPIYTPVGDVKRAAFTYEGEVYKIENPKGSKNIISGVHGRKKYAQGGSILKEYTYIPKRDVNAINGQSAKGVVSGLYVKTSLLKKNAVASSSSKSGVSTNKPYNWKPSFDEIIKKNGTQAELRKDIEVVFRLSDFNEDLQEDIKTITVENADKKVAWNAYLDVLKKVPSYRRSLAYNLADFENPQVINVIPPARFKGIGQKKIPSNTNYLENNAALKSLLPFVGNDDLRPAMMGVLFDGHDIVATDAHKLIHLKGKNSVQRVVVNPRNGEAINETDKKGFHKFPNWEVVIPSTESAETIEIDVAAIEKIIARATSTYNAPSMDGWAKNNPISIVILNGSDAISYNAQLLSSLVVFAKIKGVSKVFLTYFPSSPSKATIGTTKKYTTKWELINDDFVLLMPYQFSDTDYIAKFAYSNDKAGKLAIYKNQKIYKKGGKVESGQADLFGTYESGGLLNGVEPLPYAPAKYFKTSRKRRLYKLRQLKPTRQRSTGVANAAKIMLKTYNGEHEARKAIAITAIDEKNKFGEQMYKILDGNSTYAVAKHSNWPKIYAIQYKSEETFNKYNKK